MRKLIPLCPSAVLWLLFSSYSGAIVYEVQVDDNIQPISAEFIHQAIERADQEQAKLLIIKLNTPGGPITSMQDIITAILSANTPVAVLVFPSGGQAASAGFFITLSADVAAMAPGTSLGAAHPVFGGGGEVDDVMMQKAEHAAAANLRSIVERRERNLELAEKAVRESAAFSAKEALEGGLIDYIVVDSSELIATLDGSTIKRFNGDEVPLQLEGELIDVIEMGLRQRILSVLVDPNLTFLLMSLGILGLYVEFTHPGLIFPGAIGAISLILSFYAMQTLPVNYAGLLLILLGLILFLLELKIVSYGMLTVGGMVSFIIGGLMLFKGDSPAMRISLSLLFAVALSMGLIIAFLLNLVIRTQRRPARTGGAGMVGRIGLAVTDITPEGKGLFRGEYWKVHSKGGIRKGEKIRVTHIQGLSLEVEPYQQVEGTGYPLSS